MDRSPPEAADNSRINETADDFNDLTPLLESDAEPDEIHVTDETSDEPAASDEHQGPLDGSCDASSEKPEPSDAKPQPAQTADDFNDQTPLLGSDAEPDEIHVIDDTSDEQAASGEHQGPLDGSCDASSEETPPSDAKLQPVQATPSQKYEDLVIDDELYALGGAVGGSDLDIECSSADMDAVRRSTAELDAIYGSTAELDAMRLSRAETDAIRPSKTKVYAIRCSKEEMDEIFGAIARILSTGDMDTILRLQEKMNAIRLSKEEMDAIGRSTADETRMRYSTREMDAKRHSKEDMDAKRRSKEDLDAKSRSKEDMDAKRRSKEDMDAKRRSKEDLDEKKEETDAIRPKEEMNAIHSSTADTTGMRSSTGEMDAKLSLEKEMDAIRRSTAEMGEVIRRSTAEIDAIRRVEAEIDAMRRSKEEKAVECGSTAAVSDAVGNSIIKVIDNSSGADKASSEVQADFDKIVKVLFLSWLHFPPKRSRETHEFEFFTPEALQSLTVTWKLLKTKIDVLPEPEIVVKGLTETILQHIHLRNLNLPEDALAALRRAMSTRVTELVEEGWQKVLDGIEKEELERKRKRKERRRKFRERMRRAEEIADVLRFYAPIAQLDNDPPMDCRRFGGLICGYFSLFIYQIPISILLLGWPISIGVMGGLYMTQCPMSQLMPYVMIALGVVGTVALLLRLSYAIYEAFAFYAIHSWWPGILLKSIEFIFLDCLIVHLMYFFSDTPNFVPGTSKYCNETFYHFVSWMNWLSIALVCYWIFVYVTRGVLWLRRRNFDYSYRRH